MKNRMLSLAKLLAANLLGLTLTLAFAPYEVFPFAVLAPAGLLLLWQNVNRWQAFWRGYAFGLGFFGLGVYWIYISIHYFGEVAIPLAILITSGFIALLALFPATVGYLLSRYFPQPSPGKMLCAFPAIWVLSEWVRSWVFGGFPWLLLGYSQTHSPLKGYAPLFSVYGVSLAVVFSSSLLVRSYTLLQIKKYQSAYLHLLALTGIWLGGALLALIPWTKPQGQALTVSLVQGNVPQSIKWSPKHLQFSLDRYQAMTERLWAKNQLIVWPESAVPTTLQEASTYIDGLNALAVRNNSQLLLGIPIEANLGYYNAIVALGQTQQVYSKRYLVPFGEFTPYNKWISGLFSFFAIPTANMIPGAINQAPFSVADIKLWPAICFEIAFPELMNTDDKSIGILLVVTNDAWFGRSTAQAQHLQIAEMRALELQRPVLFVSNNGITAIIDEQGNIAQAIPPYQAGVLSGTVQARFGLTPWMQNKMAPLHFLLLYLLFIAIREKYKKPRANAVTVQQMQLTEQ